MSIKYSLTSAGGVLNSKVEFKPFMDTWFQFSTINTWNLSLTYSYIRRPLVDNSLKSLDYALGNWKPVWYRRIFPFLPIVYQHKKLRFLQFQLYDCSCTVIPITGKHFVDLLKANSNGKCYQPKWIGFRIWY